MFSKNNSDKTKIELLEHKNERLQESVDSLGREIKSLTHNHKLEVEEIKHLAKLCKEKQECEHRKMLQEKDREHLHEIGKVSIELHKGLTREIRASHDELALVLKTLIENLHCADGKK